MRCPTHPLFALLTWLAAAVASAVPALALAGVSPPAAALGRAGVEAALAAAGSGEETVVLVTEEARSLIAVLSDDGALVGIESCGWTEAELVDMEISLESLPARTPGRSGLRGLRDLLDEVEELAGVRVVGVADVLREDPVLDLQIVLSTWALQEEMSYLLDAVLRAGVCDGPDWQAGYEVEPPEVGDDGEVESDEFDWDPFAPADDDDDDDGGEGPGDGIAPWTEGPMWLIDRPGAAHALGTIDLEPGGLETASDLRRGD